MGAQSPSWSAFALANSASVSTPRSCSAASFSSRSSRPGGPDKPVDPAPADFEPNQLRQQSQGDADVEGDADAASLQMAIGNVEVAPSDDLSGAREQILGLAKQADELLK